MRVRAAWPTPPAHGKRRASARRYVHQRVTSSVSRSAASTHLALEVGRGLVEPFLLGAL